MEIKLYSEYNEKLILGAMLHENGKLIQEILADGITEESFYTPPSKLLFEEILNQHKEERLTPEGLRDELISKGLMSNGPEGQINILFWLDVEKTYLHSQQVKPAIKQLHIYQIKRKIYYAVDKGKTNLEQNTDPLEVISYISSQIEECHLIATNDNLILSTKDAAKNFVTFLEESSINQDKYVIPTGITAIDNIAGGMRKSELWVIGGEPSGGKSVIALQVTEYLSTIQKKSMIFNLEMDTESIMSRLCACSQKISLGKIINIKECVKSEIHKIQKWVEKITEEQPFFICDDADLTIDQICAKAEKQYEKEPYHFLVVDYIQLVDGGKSDTREQEVAKISRMLKKLAKKLKITVMALSQLNDDGKMRESRAIANDADVIIKITNNGLAVAKYRNAERGQMLPLYLNGPIQRFQEILK